MRLDMTSSAFKGPGGKDNYLACLDTATRHGYDFGVQLHNTAGEDEIETLAGWGAKLSAHGPLGQAYNWNLAAEDFDLAVIAQNAERFRKLGITACVFHGFFMSDKQVPAFGHGKSYHQCLMEIYRPELAMYTDHYFNNNFTRSGEFFERRERVKMRLAAIRAAHPDILWAIENDYPAYGSGNMFAADMLKLDSPLCFDTSHLWLTSKIFELDFQQQVDQFTSFGRIKMVHLHASKYDDSYPVKEWSDGHLPLSTANRMDLPRVVRRCLADGCEHFVLEIVSGTAEDIEIFNRWSKEL